MPGILTETPRKKLSGYEFYREVLGSPKFVIAPMVDQSELAWRVLSRRYGSELVYTPMINAKMYSNETNKTYQISAFDIPSGEEGANSISLSSTSSSSSAAASTSKTQDTDRPLIIQFCANDPDLLLTSALALQDHCDAVDINLGCPQDIAKKGKYGAYLMDDWELISKLISTLHQNLSVPVTAKFRVYPTVEKTVEYAKMLEASGAQILTCHGRLREQRGINTGLADWQKIAAVKKAVKVPVFANGNILFQSDILKCLEETGCDGVMSAEGNLYNPALFNGLGCGGLVRRPVGWEEWLDEESEEVAEEVVEPKEKGDQETITHHHPHITDPTHPLYLSSRSILARHPPSALIAMEYLDIVRSLRTTTALSAVKGHLFKILRPALIRETDLREKLGRIKIGAKVYKEERESGVWDEEGGLGAYVKVVREMGERLERDSIAAQVEGKKLRDLITVDPKTRLEVLPHWLLQPYFRAAPPLLTEEQIRRRSVKEMNKAKAKAAREANEAKRKAEAEAAEVKEDAMPVDSSSSTVPPVDNTVRAEKRSAASEGVEGDATKKARMEERD